MHQKRSESLTNYASEVKFHTLVKNRRIELEMTQLQVASRCNLEPTSITRIERGSRLPDMKHLPAMSDVLRIDLGRLAMTYLMSRNRPIYEAILSSGWYPKQSDISAKLDSLPEDLQASVETLVDRLLSQKKKCSSPRRRAKR